VYDSIFVPDEIKELFPDKDSTQAESGDYKNLLIDQLMKDKKLLKAGEGDSSGGSDSEPSEDNMAIEEMAKVVPMIAKTDIKKLEKVLMKKKKEEEEKEKDGQKTKQPPPNLPKKKFEESPSRQVNQRQKSP
jgi:hypothetical protein